VARSARFTTLHTLPGRIRLRVEDSALLGLPPERLEAFLRDQPGIQEVRLNQACRSVVVAYDSNVMTETALTALLENVSLDHIRNHQPARQPEPAAEESESGWFSLLLSSAAVALGVLGESAFAPWLLGAAAVPIVFRAFDTVSNRGFMNVDTLDASATAALLLQGEVQTAAVMVSLISLGHFIGDLTMQHSKRAIEDLFDGRTQDAWVIRRGEKIRVKVVEVVPGDAVVVYPGELIPVDGTILAGRATIDQKMLTGESDPVEKGEGEQVFAGTVVRDGKLYMTATKVGEDTMAAKIIRLVRDAPIHETRVQNHAEQFADSLVPYTFLAAGAAAALAPPYAFGRAASVLIIDYATGIRIAAPTAVLAAMAKAARHGILIKGGRHLDTLAEVDVVVFDKTGTLTEGTQEIVELIAYDAGLSADRVLALAAAAEQRLTHPVAQAIVQTANDRGLLIPERETSEYALGMGVVATVDGSVILVGTQHFMEYKEVVFPCRVWEDLRRIDEAAASPIFVAIDGRLVGLMAYRDPIRPEAPEIVQTLRQRGIREIVMLTGDRPAVAKKVAQDLGITRYIAEVLPDQKAAVVKELQAKGHKVAVVGDGINDSPALAQADVGIAVNGGTDVARETAHVALLHGNLTNIPLAIDIGREANTLIQQNWNMIFYPNTVALLLAIPGVLGPVGATLLSNGSALLAALNSLRPLLGGDGDGSAGRAVRFAPELALSSGDGDGSEGRAVRLAPGRALARRVP
jgi:Cu2+-exporting ATPase